VPEKIDLDVLGKRRYSGLVRVVKEKGEKEGVLEQVGYLLFVRGRLKEGMVEDREGEEALETVAGGGFLGVFDPALESEAGRDMPDLLQLALERGVLDDLDLEH